MGLILLEALLAGLIFVAIVWWTMFSGRKKGELPQAQIENESPSPPQTNPTSPPRADTSAQPPK
jgi:hypothetical protein